MEEKITWDLIDKIIEDIANKINSSNFNIEYIAPIPKGGWTVAALLAQRLNVKKSISLAQEKSPDGVKTFIANKLNYENKNVLIVEDSIETGRGLFGAKSELAKRGANVKTMALWVIPSFNGNLPDYYFNIGNIPEFPWEIKY